MTFEVLGEPKAQPRPRPRGKGHGVYNPPTADEWKNAVRFTAAEATRSVAPERWDGETHPEHLFAVSLRFQFKRPKAHYRSGKLSNILKENAPVAYRKKPDLDNLEKAVFDCLHGVFWHDDHQIIAATTTKAWAPPGRLGGVLVTVQCFEPLAKPSAAEQNPDPNKP